MSERRAAANPQTKPIDLGHESAEKWQIPRCAARAKAVYRSGCHDKHNRQQCDSNLGPLTQQSDAPTTRRPAKWDAWRAHCTDG